MGFFFRKSINFGPIRFNFSKSGIGISTGIKGARISAGPRGTYVHAGRGGFYYSQRISGSAKGQHQPFSQPQVQWQAPASNTKTNTYVIETANVSNLVETSSAELLNQINSNAKQTRFAPFAVIATLALTGLIFLGVLGLGDSLLGQVLSDRDSAITITTTVAVFLALTTLICGSVFSWRVHKGDQLKRTTPLFYELKGNAITRLAAIQSGCEALSRSLRVWRVRTNQPAWDWKRNAGASSLITRQAIYVRRQEPPFIATNIEVWSIQLNDIVLFFMPDYVFVRQNGNYGTVDYGSLTISFAPTRFIEEQGVPRDAPVLDHTWRYVNKRGGPDRRFSNNVQLPIAQYGLIQIQSLTGLNIHLHASSLEAAADFANAFSSLGFDRGQQRQATKESNQRSKASWAFEILGVSVNATSKQIVAAYRQMARMYHPDRLAHLAPEFVELAEVRMKEINAAFDVLKRSTGNL